MKVFNNGGSDFATFNVNTAGIFQAYQFGTTGALVLGGSPLMTGSEPILSIYQEWPNGSVLLATSLNNDGSIVAARLRMNGYAGTTMGVATLSGGSATVYNSLITSSTQVILTTQPGGVLANLGYVVVTSIVPSNHFTIQSSNPLDNSPVTWWLVEKN